MTKRLYRSRTEKMVAGVAGGIAEYLEIDPVFVRLAFVALVFFHGAGIILYLISAIIIPKEELLGQTEPAEVVEEKLKEKEVEKEKKKSKRAKVFGGILIVLGTLFLLENIFDALTFDNVFPIILIGVGSWMVLNTFKTEKKSEVSHED